MNIFDAHCDTLYELTFGGESLKKNNLHIDLERMCQYKSYTQFFAAWLENGENALKKFNMMVKKFDEEIEKNTEKIKKCLSYADILDAKKQNKCAAFLTLEGGYIIQTVEDVDFLYNCGVRCITLTWNGENKLAGGVDSKKGLTEFGKECIKRMESLGIIVDVSHLNEKSFWDVMGMAKKPVIASHSNSKALCSHKRNLTDEQFVAICKNGGCVGINFYDEFLTDNKNTTSYDLIEHIKHFINLGGENHIGIGSDFDGVKSLCGGISGVQDTKRIVQELENLNITDRIIDKITHKNFQRIVSYL